MKERKETGITLVALVITIIILLILAGVAIAMITGADGIITRAEKAGEIYNNAAQNEAEIINEVANYDPDRRK